MEIKKFYLETYPTDELGTELCDGVTFMGLLHQLNNGLGSDVYDYIGVHDSLVRERLFEKLSELIDEPYHYVYNLWLNGGKRQQTMVISPECFPRKANV